jgi:plasmid replication initiation protein
MSSSRSPLLPDRHPQRDMFVCDIGDSVPKGDMASMEHPVFTLSTKPDLKPRCYRNGENFIEVSPSRYGLATVHDRDVLIYCISQCMAALNEGKKVSRSLRFKAHELLIATNRQTSGQGYQLLKDALRRLQGTQVETNIRQGGKEYYRVFGLIESAEIVRETRGGRMLDVEVTLSDWVFDAIENNHVLTLNKRYFLLRKPLERRLYELARKHCGAQKKWVCGIELLRDKCGSGSTTKEFRRLLSKIIEDDGLFDHMPDYSIFIDADKVIFRPKRVETLVNSLNHTLRLISSDTLEKARQCAPGWDIYVLEMEWRSWIAEKSIVVKNADQHFLSFCKKRGAYRS